MTKFNSENARRGYEFTEGVLQCLGKFFFGVAVTFLICFCLLKFFTPTDDTDAGWWDRSGFELLTDHGTGQQYLRRGCALIERKS